MEVPFGAEPVVVLLAGIVLELEEDAELEDDTEFEEAAELEDDIEADVDEELLVES